MDFPKNVSISCAIQKIASAWDTWRAWEGFSEYVWGEAFPLNNSVGFPTPSITAATKECTGRIVATTFGVAWTMDEPTVATKRNTASRDNL